jgi:molybdopterin synthase catalytic subunit
VIGTPRIAVNKICPAQPTPKGGVYTFTGQVKNVGNVTLTNVIVVNNSPSNNTPVIGPITLAAGASADFSGSYTAPSCCCFVIDTLTATGQSLCASNVTVSATDTEVCPLLTTPSISVTERCPQGIVPIGGLYIFTGTVKNTGDVTLDDVYVYADQPASNTVVIGPITLGAGESQDYVGSFVVTSCGRPINTCVTAVGMDICLDRTVTARACCAAPREACPGSNDLVIGGNGAPAPAYENGVFTLSFMSQVGANYTVQYKDSVDGSDWSDLETVVGTGDVLTVTDATGKDARFYRVLSDR